jgi:hypothetical protein
MEPASDPPGPWRLSGPEPTKWCATCAVKETEQALVAPAGIGDQGDEAGGVEGRVAVDAFGFPVGLDQVAELVPPLLVLDDVEAADLVVPGDQVEPESGALRAQGAGSLDETGHRLGEALGVEQVNVAVRATHLFEVLAAEQLRRLATADECRVVDTGPASPAESVCERLVPAPTRAWIAPVHPQLVSFSSTERHEGSSRTGAVTLVHQGDRSAQSA